MTIYKQIQSPLVGFDLIMQELKEELNNILFGKKSKLTEKQKSELNPVVFEEKSVTILNGIKFIYSNEEIFIKLTRPLHIEELKYFTNIQSNIETVKMSILQYMVMCKELTENYLNLDVPHKLLNSLVETIAKNKQNSGFTKNLIFPINNRDLLNIPENCLVILSLNKLNKINDWRYQIFCIYDADITDDRSIDDLLFDNEENIIYDGIFTNNTAEQFLTELFFKNKLINIDNY